MDFNFEEAPSDVIIIAQSFCWEGDSVSNCFLSNHKDLITDPTHKLGTVA